MMISTDTLYSMAGGLETPDGPEAPPDIDELARDIERRIATNQEILDGLPEYELGKEARNEVISVENLINGWNQD
jgi:hypothetical protein